MQQVLIVENARSHDNSPELSVFGKSASVQRRTYGTIKQSAIFFANIGRLPRVSHTTIRAKVVHNSVFAVRRLCDFGRCSRDFNIGAVGDEVVGIS
jgi:hypothetical protein